MKKPDRQRQSFSSGIVSAVIFFGAGLLCGCGNTDRQESREFIAMGTYITLTACGSSAGEGLAAAEEKITALEKLWSVNDENSEIYKANRSGGEAVHLHKETAGLLRSALETAEKTGGAFDPTVYPLVEAWGFNSHEYRIPEDDEIKRLLENVGYRKIKLEGETLRLPAGVRIDLGAVGKGYAGDAAAALLKKAGINSALLNIGGNVQAVGRKPDGNKWIIGIRNPFDKGGLAGIIEAENTAVITSGGYERCFTGSDGRTYHHIIDPETGRPAESGLASVTVIAESGEYADSLSTALFVMGQEKAAAYWRNLGTAEPAKETDAGEKPFDMIIITNSGELFITEGVSGNFTPADDYTGSLTVLEK